MSARKLRIPSYRFHKPSNRAVVTINGRDFWLGKYDTPESRAKYDRLIAEWLGNGRQSPATKAKAPADLTVLEVVARFWAHVQEHYRRTDRTPTKEVDNFRQALKPLNALYGNTPAKAFGPRGLRAVRQKMVELGWCRRYINKQVSRLKLMFSWAVGQQLLGPEIPAALERVEGLRKGKTEAMEHAPVKPVADEHVEATLRFCNRQVGAMVRLQDITGMRPGEVVMMRGVDIDTKDELWAYHPAHHKTEHHGHDRAIYLGPQARAIVQEFLKPDLKAYLFSPAEAERERREVMHKARVEHGTPLSCGNIPGSNRQRSPRKTAGEHYTVESYGRAIKSAADKADRWAKAGRVIGNDERTIPRWHPHQLRHTAGTRLRKEYGLEAAQVILGHKTLTVTQVYAEKNVEAALATATVPITLPHASATQKRARSEVRWHCSMHCPSAGSGSTCSGSKPSSCNCRTAAMSRATKGRTRQAAGVPVLLDRRKPVPPRRIISPAF